MVLNHSEITKTETEIPLLQFDGDIIILHGHSRDFAVFVVLL